MRSLLKLVTLFAAAMMLTMGAAQAQPKEKVVLMLNWYLYSEHAPFFLGKARGYYDQEGIDLDVQEGRGSGVTVQAVAANTATFGYVDVPTMIKAAAKGAPVRAVGVALQVSPMSVMGFADKNIRAPKDIVGKTVAVTPGDSMSQIWPLFLKKTGIKETDFKTVAGDAQTKLNAVMNGQADLLLGYVMDQAIKLQDATQKPVYPIRFADYGVNLISSGIVANTDTLKSRPDMVKRFLRATTKEGRRAGNADHRAQADHRPLSHQGDRQATAAPRSHGQRWRIAGPARAVWRPRPGDQGQARGLGDAAVPALIGKDPP